MRFFFFLQKELLKEDAVDLSCCCETSQELLGATFPAGAGHGRAGGAQARLWCCAGQGQPPCLVLQLPVPSLCCTAMSPANRNGSHWSDTPWH